MSEVHIAVRTGQTSQFIFGIFICSTSIRESNEAESSIPGTYLVPLPGTVYTLGDSHFFWILKFRIFFKPFQISETLETLLIVFSAETRVQPDDLTVALKRHPNLSDCLLLRVAWVVHLGSSLGNRSAGRHLQSLKFKHSSDILQAIDQRNSLNNLKKKKIS